jgi:hypothetical protein
MGNRKKKHRTTKNTLPKNPVTRLRVIGVECNGRFNLVTDFHTQKEFNDLFDEWFNHPETRRWCAESLIEYIKKKQPKRICLLEEDYNEIIKGEDVIPATKEEWLSEQN